MGLKVHQLTVCIKTRGRACHERFLTGRILHAYFPRNPVILIVSDDAADYREWIKREQLGWTVHQCDVGIYEADREIFLGDTGLGPADFFIYANDDVSSVQIVCRDPCMQTKNGKPKQLIRGATMSELHADLQSGLDALSRFGGCLLGFPTNAGVFPDTPMMPRTHFLPMLDVLCIAKRGPVQVYTKEMWAKSDLAKTCLSYESAGWNIRLDRYKISAGYDETNPPGGLGDVEDRSDGEKRLQSEYKSERAMIERFPLLISGIKQNWSGNRSFNWRRGRKPRVVFEAGAYCIRDDWDNTDESEDAADSSSTREATAEAYIDSCIVSARETPGHPLCQGQMRASELLGRLRQHMQGCVVDDKVLGQILKRKLECKRFKDGIYYSLPVTASETKRQKQCGI